MQIWLREMTYLLTVLIEMVEGLVVNSQLVLVAMLYDGQGVAADVEVVVESPLVPATKKMSYNQSDLLTNYSHRSADHSAGSSSCPT